MYREENELRQLWNDLKPEITGTIIGLLALIPIIAILDKVLK